MIRAHEDPRVGRGAGGETSEERVRVAVGPLDGRRAASRVAHETVRDRVDLLEVNEQQVGLTAGEDRLRHPRQRPRAGHDRGEVGQRVSVEAGVRRRQGGMGVLELLGGEGHIGREVRPSEVGGPYEEGRQGLRRRRRRDRPIVEPGVGADGLGSDAVGDDGAPHALRWPGGPPAHHAHAAAPRGEHVPERLHAPVGGGDRGLTAGRKVDHEVEHPVVLGPASGGDRRPDDRRDEGWGRQHDPGAARRLEPREGGEPARLDQRVDDPPVGSVQAEEDEASAGGGSGFGPSGRRGSERERAQERDARQERHRPRGPFAEATTVSTLPEGHARRGTPGS